MRSTATSRSTAREQRPDGDAAARLIRVEQRLAARTEELRELRASRSYRALQFLWRLRRPRVLALIGTIWVGAVVGAMAAGWLLAAVVFAAASASLLLVVGAVARSSPTTSSLPPRKAGSRIKELTEVPRAPSVPPPSGPTGDVVRRRRRGVVQGWALPDLTVASILDEMSHACFAPECNLIPLPVEEAAWREILQDAEPDLLLVESAWAANTGAWQYRVARYPSTDGDSLRHLRKVVDQCRELEIPTAFWNKEDPVHFERFKEAAALFDHVFTTDERCREKYARLPGLTLDRVHVLPFAAQPRLHNPVEVVESRRGEPCFAGTFYRDRHPERQATLEAMLDAALPFGLVIYDRMAGSNSAAYEFPERFKASIAGRLDYDEVVRAYKQHTIFLNANSVVASTTMCSRRIFELLASETAVISSPSRSLQPLFDGTVLSATTRWQATEAIQRLADDENRRKTQVVRGRRLVLSEHHYGRRLERICEALGLNHRIDEQAQSLAAMTALEPGVGHWEVSELVEQLARQSFPPGELLIGAVGEGGTYDALLDHYRARVPGATARVVLQSEIDQALRFRELAALATASWVSPLAVDRRLPDDYLVDLRQATTYTDADVIGVALEAGVRQRYVDVVDPERAIVRRSVAARRGWPSDAGQRGVSGWFREGVRLFAA